MKLALVNAVRDVAVRMKWMSSSVDCETCAKKSKTVIVVDMNQEQISCCSHKRTDRRSLDT